MAATDADGTAAALDALTKTAATATSPRVRLASLKKSPVKSTDVHFARFSSLGLRTASIFFFVGFVWHSTLLPNFYNTIGPEIAARVQLSGSHLDAFKEPTNLDSKVLRDFGFAGAASHTIVFLFGLLCATMLRTVKFGAVVRNSGGRPEPIGIGVSLVLVVWSAAVFHVLAQAFAKYAFETQFGPVYQYATIFYKSTGGESPFAWASSVSFTMALLMGFFISDEISVARFEKMIFGPFHGVFARGGTLASVVVPFAIWLGVLDRFLIPLSHAYLDTTGTTSTTDEILDGSHAFAFAIGLIMTVGGTATRAIAQYCCVGPNGEKVVEAQQEASGPTTRRVRRVTNTDYSTSLDMSNVVNVFQTLAGTLALSTSLLASALFKAGDLPVATVLAIIWRPLAIGAFFVVVAVVVTLGAQNFHPVQYVLHRAPRFVRNVTQRVLIGVLWNVHAFPFLGCWVPFHVFAYAVPRLFPGLAADWSYSQLDALFDGLLYAFTGPYLAPVLIQGVLKIGTARMKARWGLLQESLMACCVIVPPTVTVYLRWQQGHVSLPVHLFMSAMELLYLLTWRNRPEYSGWRDWPELKSSRIWWLLEDYFHVRMIVDSGKPGQPPLKDLRAERDPPQEAPTREHVLAGFEPGRARIIGFHPHGMFPCTVIWQHLIPMWARLFGALVPYQLTDAFTHLPPGLREVQQWSGGREITRDVMTEMLTYGETVIVCPGGQSELLMHTAENTKAKRFVLCAKHKGFLRVAMETGAEVVPMLSFGELTAIQNLNLRTLHKVSKRFFGAPVPFIPVGVWGVFPFPRRVPFTLVFGQPIPCVPKEKGKPTDEEVDRVYHEYFDEITQLYETYAGEAGFGEWKLVLNGYKGREKSD